MLFGKSIRVFQEALLFAHLGSFRKLGELSETGDSHLFPHVLTRRQKPADDGEDGFEFLVDGVHLDAEILKRRWLLNFPSVLASTTRCFLLPSSRIIALHSGGVNRFSRLSCAPGSGVAEQAAACMEVARSPLRGFCYPSQGWKAWTLRDSILRGATKPSQGVFACLIVPLC